MKCLIESRAVGKNPLRAPWKYSDADVEKAYAMKEEGQSSLQIANELVCSLTTVKYLLEWEDSQ